MIKTENKLDYSETRDFSLATSSRYYKAQAPRTQYTENEIIEVRLDDLNKNDFVDGSKSYLKFVFYGYETDELLFRLGEHGSMLSLFKTIQLIAKDGQTIDTYDNVAQYATTQLLCHPDRSYVDCIGANFAYNGVAIATDVDTDMIIPMAVIMPLFKSANLLPPEIMSGMRIRFTLYDAPHIVEDPIGDLGHTFTISKFSAVLKTYRMDDIALKQLANDSNQIEYPSYIHKEKYFTTDGNNAYINMSINHDIEKATRAVCIALPEKFDPWVESPIFDNIEDPINHTGVRWKIGQLYTDPLDTALEQLVHLQTVFNTNHVDRGSYRAIHAIDLTRSAVQKGSTPLDNSNDLTIEFKKATNRNQYAHLYVEYQKTIKF